MALEDICITAGDCRVSFSFERGDGGVVEDIDVPKKDVVVEIPKSEANFSFG